MNACSVDGCGRDSRANGMCETHYRQVKRTGTTSPIRPRREPAEKPSHPVKCGGCGQIVGNATSETTAQTVLRNHRCQPAPATEGKPAMPLPLKAVPDKPARPHPSKLVDHPSRRVARAAQRVMDAVAALDEAWAADAEKAELRAERDRLKAELAQVEQRLRGGPTVVRDWEAIRAWAADNGHDCPDTGKVSGRIVAAYDQAHR